MCAFLHCSSGLEVTTVTLSGEEHKLWSTPLCSFSICSYFLPLSPTTCISTLFWNFPHKPRRFVHSSVSGPVFWRYPVRVSTGLQAISTQFCRSFWARKSTMFSKYFSSALPVVPWKLHTSLTRCAIGWDQLEAGLSQPHMTWHKLLLMLNKKVLHD